MSREHVSTNTHKCPKPKTPSSGYPRAAAVCTVDEASRSKSLTTTGFHGLSGASALSTLSVVRCGDVMHVGTTYNATCGHRRMLTSLSVWSESVMHIATSVWRSLATTQPHTVSRTTRPLEPSPRRWSNHDKRARAVATMRGACARWPVRARAVRRRVNGWTRCTLAALCTRFRS